MLSSFWGISYSLRQPASQPVPSNSTTVTNQTDQTAGWSVYTNLQYNYSFKYPSGFSLYASKGEKSRSVIITNYDPSKVPLNEVSAPISGSRVKIDILAIHLEAGTQTITSPQELSSWIDRQSAAKNPAINKREVRLVGSANYLAVEEVLSTALASGTFVTVRRYISDGPYIIVVTNYSPNQDITTKIIESLQLQ